MIKICPECGKEFVARNGLQKYCTEECRTEKIKKRYKEKAANQNCVVCGTPFKSNCLKKTCSKACRNVLYESTKKKNQQAKKKKPKPPSIEEVQRLAREKGMTYGQYVGLMMRGD